MGAQERDDNSDQVVDVEEEEEQEEEKGFREGEGEGERGGGGSCWPESVRLEQASAGDNFSNNNNSNNNNIKSRTKICLTAEKFNLSDEDVQ